jgi:eukaryotic-like serine/threonine-protein kinase
VSTAAFDDLRPGALVDRYELLERLSDEGAAVVFRARHLDLNREVALSLLRPEATAGDPAAADRFRESAMLMARLEHPAIAPIYSLGEDEGTVWVASRLLTGTTLADAAASGLTPAQTVHIVEALADALGEIHDAGVVHRDLRPDNVWLVRGRAPLLGPPGVRRSDGRTRTTTGLMLGSAQYLAPEQILGQGAEPASDVFSLGAVAVACLTGEAPFRAGSLGLLLATRPSAPSPVLTVEGASTAALNAALARVMAAEPAERPATATDAARAIATALSALPAAIRERRRALAPGEPEEGEAEPQRARPPEPAAAVAPPGATRVDRQRPALEVPETPRTGPSRWQIAAVALTAVALPVLCFLAGRTLAGSPDGDVAAGPFTVRFDDRWAVSGDAPPAAVGDAFTRPAVLRGEGGTIALAGALARPGPPPDPLGEVAPTLLGDQPGRRVIRLGRRTAVRYDGTLTGTTTRLHAVVVPTTRAPLAVLCVGPSVDRAACDALAANARLGAARPAAPRPSAATAASLGDVLTKLHNNVSRRQLEAETAKGAERARAIGAVQDAYRLGLEQLTAARIAGPDRPIAAQLTGDLRRVIAAYESLLTSGADPAVGARRVTAAVGALRRTVRGLEARGYRVAADGA